MQRNYEFYCAEVKIMAQVLILFAHPAFEKSRVNRQLVGHVQGLSGVTFHDLYEAYYTFDIDVSNEQKLLETHDCIIFQFPFFWYSTPALMKQWQDLVLEHGWAYGSKATALHGKCFLCVTTVGGSEAAYHREGHNRFTVRELLAPLEQTANLCGMVFLTPFVVHGTHRMAREDIAQAANDYRRIVEALRDETIDLEATKRVPFINANLDSIIRKDATV